MKKKEYISPELKDFGKLADVTKTTGSGGVDDGGGATAYTS